MMKIKFTKDIIKSFDNVVIILDKKSSLPKQVSEIQKYANINTRKQMLFVKQDP